MNRKEIKEITMVLMITTIIRNEDYKMAIFLTFIDN